MARCERGLSCIESVDLTDRGVNLSQGAEAPRAAQPNLAVSFRPVTARIGKRQRPGSEGLSFR